MRREALASTAAIAAVLALTVFVRAQSDPAVHPADQQAAAGGPMKAQGTTSAGFPFSADPLAKRSLADLLTAARGGVLSGVAPDGEWVCAPSGGLRPDRRVRLRMDWYGNQLGPMSADELAEVLAAEAAEACGIAAGGQARQVWRSYQDATLAASGTVPADRVALQKLADAAAAARRRSMGAEWAEAFFGDDERLLAAQLAKNGPVEPMLQPLPDAGERTVEVEAAWANWRQRIAAAQQEANTLRRDASLSPEALAGKIAELIERRFEAGERARAAGLLRVDSGA